MTCKIFYSTANNHCVTKLCKQHCPFLQNRTTNVRRVAQFRDNHRVSGKIVESVTLWLQKLPRCTLYLDLVFCFKLLRLV